MKKGRKVGRKEDYNSVSGVIYHTQGRVFPPISNADKWVERHKAQPSVFFFLKQIRGVWKSDETLYRMFDTAAQTNRPFYSCVLSDLALDCKRGWGVTLF